MTFNPDKRITVEDAINHPYFANLKKLDNPPRCQSTFNWGWEADMQAESQKRKDPYFDRKMICKLIYNESLTYHPEEPSSPKKEPAEKSGEEASPKQTDEITELPVKNPEKALATLSKGEINSPLMVKQNSTPGSGAKLGKKRTNS